MRWFHNTILRVNAILVGLRRPRAAPGNVLLLLPHCLKKTSCGRDVVTDPANCERCGGCNVKELLALRDELGIQLRVASGGRQAVAAVREPSVKVVVAVACEKELYEGVMAAFPKPVIAVPNEQPEGYCRNTRVDISKVREIVLRTLER